MTHRRLYSTTATMLVAAMAMALVLAMTCSCRSQPPSGGGKPPDPAKPQTPELGRNVVTAARATAVAATQTAGAIDRITADKLPETKATAQAKAVETITRANETVTAAVAVVPAAVEDAHAAQALRDRIAGLERELASERDSSAIVRRLRAVAFWLIIASLAAPVAYGVACIWIAALRPFWKGVIAGAGGGLFVAFGLIAIARFMSAIVWIVAGTGALAATAALAVAVWFIVRWLRTRGGLKQVVQSIDLGVSNGVLGWTPAMTSLANVVQSPATKRMVNEVQRKDTPRKPMKE